MNPSRVHLSSLVPNEPSEQAAMCIISISFERKHGSNMLNLCSCRTVLLIFYMCAGLKFSSVTWEERLTRARMAW